MTNMGKDYDMKPWSLPGMYPEVIDEFIKDWLRHFHDTHNRGLQQSSGHYMSL